MTTFPQGDPASAANGPFSGSEWQFDPQRTWDNGVALLENEECVIRMHGVRGIERAVRYENAREDDAVRVLTAFVARHRRWWRFDDEAVRAARRVLRGGTADRPWWSRQLRDLTAMERSLAVALVVIPVVIAVIAIVDLFR
ncbi:hypothetical protein [Embleya sp. MST-111070]|uniref:hypothetical protein n=1 Tax=Embleya sp. MST-111070 TaxID=3398231 RepID=UPI003F73E0C1